MRQYASIRILCQVHGLALEWLVIKVTANARLGGDIVELRGRIKGQDGQTAVGAKGRVLVTERL